MPLCEYGCGREATTQFKNGKWCCNQYFKSCPIMRENQKGKPAWNKGKTGVFSEETRIKMSEKRKGKSPWNKGKTGIYSEESLKKMSESSKGFIPWIKGKKVIYSEETRKKLSHIRKRENLSEETLRKMSEIKKGKQAWNKGKKGISEETRKKLSEARKNLSEETRRKVSLNSRLHMIKRIEENKLNGHQLCPFFNPAACALLDEYGKQHGYNIKHAMNGGEHYFNKLGFWVDGYDIERNTVFEVDEKHHFDADGNLCKKDIERQQLIIEHTSCTFIRLKI
jgi:hypothetical protein